MNREKSTQSHLLMGGGFHRIIPVLAFTITYICGNLLGTSTAYAAGVPGGNISDPVIRGVDIAKPAVVRIIGTLGARLTVDIQTTTSIVTTTFPRFGDSYKLQYFGSGAFVSAHGDILTADHIVNPPHDASLNQALYELAAKDLADYINVTFHPNVPWTATDAFAALVNGSFKSQAHFDGNPTLRAYLSTDFTGLISNATTLADMPQGTYADVDNVLKTNDFEHGDTAIIHVNLPDTPSIKLGDSTTVEPQDQLTLIGFPGNGDIPTENTQTTTNTVNPSTGFFTASINKVYVSAIKQTTGKASLIQVGGNVEHGDSGGPVLDSNGNIVGVASFVGTTAPNGTGFLQASSTAQQMINALQLDTHPGTFESAWDDAFAQYSSNEAGHWHLAQQKLQKLQTSYPNFHAIQDYLDYATKQANKETTTTNLFSNPLLLIAILFILIVISALVLVQFLGRRRKRLQAAVATQAASYEPSYYGARLPLESEQRFSSASLAQIDLKDGADQNSGRNPYIQLAQPRAMQSMPQVPETPTRVPQPDQTSPTASYQATQSGPLPVVPNQPPTNPWPQQSAQYGSAPVYGQPVPYGQQPYNAAQQPRPVQRMPNPPYSPQQQPFPPYPQAPATPWPPVPSNVPPPPAGAPYAPQNPAQQGTPIQRGQQPPAPYGQPPQGYGVMSAPAQSWSAQPSQVSQQSSVSIPAQPQQAFTPPSEDASTTSDESTVRARPQGASTLEEITKLAEDKKNIPPPIPVVSKDETEMATRLSEKDSPTRFSDQ